MKKRWIATLLVGVNLINPLSVQAEARQEIPLSQAQTYPYHLTQALFIKKSPTQTVRGTGTYLGQGLMLTAAHNLTDQEGQYKSEQEALSYNAQGQPLFQTAPNSNSNPYHILPDYQGYNDLAHDIAFISGNFPQGQGQDRQTLPLAIYPQLQDLVGKEVETMGFSSLTHPPYTQSSGRILRVEPDGTLTASLSVVEENSGSPIFVNGQIIGLLTAVTEECAGQGYCSQATITPLTLEMKEQLLDPLRIQAQVIQ